MAYSRSRGPNRGPRSNYQQNATAEQVTFYADNEKKIINKALLNEDAEKQAKALHNRVGSSQVRKFFGEIKNMSLRLEQGRSWQELEPLFKMVKSKAWYASKQSNSAIPDEFRAFITDNIDRVNDEADFKAFVLYFEAVMGFAYGLGFVKK